MQGSEGWSRAALAKAAAELQFSPALAGICSRGEADLVEFFVRQCNEVLFQRIAAEGAAFNEKDATEKVKLAVRWRLEMHAPVIGVCLICVAPLPFRLCCSVVR